MESIMVRHIVSWNFKENLSDNERCEHGKQIKTEIESLKACIEGIIYLKVHINLLSSSNKDVVLDSVFKSEDDLIKYQAHPEHVRVSEYVGTVVKDRACVDYLEKDE
jgi:hypothetical protein